MIPAKMKKLQEGFTLVEVIVVAIIVAALAAVAIPVYNSYVTSSKVNMASNASGAIASFMGACVNQSGTASVTPTAVAAGDDIVGDGTRRVSCAVTGIATPATILVPNGITVEISSYTATETVDARPSTDPDGTNEQTYRY